MARSVLITGGGGFIGVNLVKELQQETDYGITVVDNGSNSDLSEVESLGVECLRLDIRDQDQMRLLLQGRAAVIHLAADTRVMDSIANPVFNFENNVVASFHLLRNCVDAGVPRFINASTGGAIIGECIPPVREDMPARPLSPYGAAKLAVEGYCTAFAGSYGLQACSLRFSNVYGPYSHNKGSAVAHFMRRILAGQDLVVYGDGSQVRDFIFVGDLVRGIRQALIGGAQGAFNLGTGIPVSINELLTVFREVVPEMAHIKVHHQPPRQGEVLKTWCDGSKARKELAFNPNTDLRDGIARTWEWFKSAASGKNRQTQVTY